MADYTLFKLRGDTRANWLAANPILNNRELAMETDTKRFKVGDGLATYSQLPYGRNTGEYLNFYNVTAFLPLPAGYYYTHDQAISKVAVNERCKGLIVSYEVSSGVWYTERFIGTDVANWSVLANWEKMPDSSDLTALHDVITAYNNHAANTSNPHSVTKEQIGLLNIDNTSDADKPVSTAQQTALNLKADKARQVIAGSGLTGGGTLESDRTINVTATDDSIIIAADGIKVDTQNLLTSTSATKPLAANQGKVLDEKITQVGADLNKIPDNLEPALAEILNQQNKRIEALESLIKNMLFKNGQFDIIDVVKQLNIYGGTNLVIVGTAAPAIVPDFIGQWYINTSGTGTTYQAKGNASTSDWKQTSN